MPTTTDLPKEPVCDRSHVVARRLVAIMLDHVTQHFKARDFAVAALTDEIADAIDDEITAAVQQTMADISNSEG
jgi:hypothetical protein